MRRVQVVRDEDVSVNERTTIRQLIFGAFADRFSEDDWVHTLGGWRIIASEDGVPISHAAVVPRRIQLDTREFVCGYVEGVATQPGRQREGLGSVVLAEVATVLRRNYEVGFLSTSRQEFYASLGWEGWLGPTFVREGASQTRTEEEDDGIMVLRFGPSKAVSLTAAISCEARSGDDW